MALGKTVTKMAHSIDPKNIKVKNAPIYNTGSYHTNHSTQRIKNLAQEGFNKVRPIQEKYNSINSEKLKMQRKAVAQSEAKKRGINLKPHTRSITPVSELSKAERNARKRELSIRRAPKILDGVEPSDKFLRRIGLTGTTLFRSAVGNLSAKGNLATAGKKVVQSATVGAASSAGLAYLQGDDPWQAAKGGAFKGALVGASYQGLKAATHTPQAIFKGGATNIGRTVADTYKAHTSAGQAAFRQNGMSSQLQRVLQTNQSVRMNQSIFGLNGK